MDRKVLHSLGLILIAFSILIIVTQLFILSPILSSNQQDLLVGRVYQPTLAQDMLNIWGKTGQLAGSVALGFDFLFMLTVGLMLAVGWTWIAPAIHVVWAKRVGLTLSWAALVGTSLDWIETLLR
jgi:hypothetical protein